jgi:hypothetical protein
MNHPRSVLERDPHEVASMMMASARGEQPPAQLRLHVITAIGGAGALGTAASAASAASAATAIAGTATSAKLLMAAPLMLAVKWAVVGIAAGVLTVGVSEGTRNLDRSSNGSNTPVIGASDRNRAKPAPVEPDDRAAIPGEIATSTGEARAGLDGLSAAAGDVLRSKVATGGAKPRVSASNAIDVARQLERDDPTAVAASSSKPASVAPEGALRPSLGSLGAEVALLDEARSALAGHDPARALRAIESYELAFSSGRLLMEATALRIEAHVANHEYAVAQALGQRFLTANPRGPLANRVRGLLDDQ